MPDAPIPDANPAFRHGTQRVIENILHDERTRWSQLRARIEARTTPLPFADEASAQRPSQCRAEIERFFAERHAKHIRP